MLARLYHALAIVSIATLFALNGLLVYLSASGRLGGGRAQAIAALLRGEPVQTGGVSEPPVPKSGDEGAVSGGPTLAEARTARQRAVFNDQVLDRAKQDVLARQRLLDQALQNLLDEQEKSKHQIETAKDQEKRNEQAAAGEEVGFKREVEIVAGLSPNQAKEHVVRLWKKAPADAVRLVMNLDSSRAKKILAQMKTPDELEVMSQLLEQLREQDPESYAKESGTTGP
jgi:flagellar motility protein MotE (MotC chaperone)